MSTIIDELIVLLGIKSDGLEAKAGSATKALTNVERAGTSTEKSVASVGKASKETARSASDLSRSLIGLLSVIGGTVAIKAFVNDFIASGAALDRFSKNVNIGASTISAWGNATEQVGGSAQALQGTLAMLSNEQTNLMIKGESGLLPYFSAMGIAIADVNGKALKSTDVLANMASWAEGEDRPTAHNLFAQMGIDEGTINLLLKGRKELELTLARQKAYGEQMAKFAPIATQLQTSLVGLRQKFTLLGLGLLQDAAPGIEYVINKLTSFADWCQANSQVIEDFFKVMTVGFAAIAIAAAPIELTTVALVALGAGIALVWQDYQTWKKGGDSFIDWGKWEPAITAATNGIHVLAEAMKDAWGWFSKIHDSKPLDDLREKLGVNKFWGMGEDRKPNPNAKPVPQVQGGTVAQRAYIEAERVSEKTGIPAKLVYAQWQHETNNFTNRGAKDLNNFAGVNVPGGKGEDYRKFKTMDEFGDYYAHLMRPDGRYPEASKAKTPEDFAAALQHGGYYADSQENYTKGLNHWLKKDATNTPYAQSLNGIPGASQAAASAPQSQQAPSGGATNSVQLTISQMDIHTQATDAMGIAKDMFQSMDYLLTANANTGLS